MAKPVTAISVWSFKPLGIFEGRHCYTVATFFDYGAAFDFIKNPVAHGADPGNYYMR